MALFGSMATVKAQAWPADTFAAAFAYLEVMLREDSAAAARMRAMSAGETQRIELGGGAFALEQVYTTKARAEGFFESHRKFIDVQVIVEGEEWMEVVDRWSATVKQPYHGERDLTVYEDVAGASVLHLRAGDVAVFYPADVHMPGLTGGGAAGGLVRKTVIKVPASA